MTSPVIEAMATEAAKAEGAPWRASVEDMEPMMLAALKALEENITDEMLEAALEVTSKPGSRAMRNIFTAMLRAAREE